MRSPTIFRVLACTLLLGTAIRADRAQELALKAKSVEREVCEDVDNFSDCHDNFLTGCSHSERSNYDAYLNFLKNQTPAPGLDSVRTLNRKAFAQLDQGVPPKLSKGNHATFAPQLAKLGEGNIHTVIGYLYYSMKTGSETCNCQLSGTRNVDFHLGIGFDAMVAAQLRNNEDVDEQELSKTSIVVEMTPHYRANHHSKWTLVRLKQALGRQVKVVGQLMADNEHNNPKDNCASQGAKDTCWRASLWELHPVIQFYVCDADSACSENSPDWKKLDDM